MQRQRTRPSSDPYPQARPGMRVCEHPGCTCEGLYRAPKGRNRLNEYYWFCLDHVREYNQSWDYYAGMSPDQIEAETRRDTTWQRPTWPMGHWAAQERFLRDRVVRGFGFQFGSESDLGGDRKTGADAKARTEVEQAFDILELSPPIDFPGIKARYRELVKRHHPDANGGDKSAEEKLKSINQAYTTLKACYGT